MSSRRSAKIDTLYDVMCSIRDDEAEHVKTMAACQDREALRRAPGTEKAVAATLLSVAAAAFIALNAPAEWSTAVTAVLSRAAESTESALQSARSAAAEALSGVISEGGAEQVEGAVEESAPSLLDSVLRLLSRLRG
jgi:cell division ATPase FtsA